MNKWYDKSASNRQFRVLDFFGELLTGVAFGYVVADRSIADRGMTNAETT